MVFDGHAEAISAYSLFGGRGSDTLIGGAGADSFNMLGFLTSTDTLDGGGGTDLLRLNGDYSAGLTFTSTTMVNVETIIAMAGHIYNLTLDDATNSSGLTLSAINLTASDVMVFDGSAETTASLHAVGGMSKDTLIGGQGVDTLNGNGGDDVLSGRGGNDIIFGGDGDDTLIGGLGDDSLTGGAGRDVFKYTDLGDAGTGNDRVTDFTLGSTGDVLNVHFNVASTGALMGTADARLLPGRPRVEILRIWPPSDKSVLQIGRFALPYEIEEP